jgi:hypothetical protein
MRRIPITRFLIDGEAVTCGQDGASDFEGPRLQEQDAIDSDAV